MAYTTAAIIRAYLNGKDVIPFFDDESSGDAAAAQAALDQCISTCSMECDGYVANAYATPFGTPPPAKIGIACTVFVCEAAYARRLSFGERNPFSDRAKQWRDILAKVGDGEIGLDYTIDRAFEPGAVVTADVVFNQTTM